MNKYRSAFLVGLSLFFAGRCRAEMLCTNWGLFNLCLPLASGIDVAFGYDFSGHHSQGLAETPLGVVALTNTSKLVVKAGGITSENGKGAPFIGVDYELNDIANPIPGVASIKPGIYGGHDFHVNDSFYGIKASMPIFQ